MASMSWEHQAQAEWDRQDREADATVDERRDAQAYFNAGLPWTGEFEELVNEGLVDVS